MVCFCKEFKGGSVIKENTYRYKIELESLKEVKDFRDQLLKIRNPPQDICELIESLTFELSHHEYE